MFNPNFALNILNNNVHKAFPNICKQYETHVDINKLQFEWQILPLAFSKSELNIIMEYEVSQFWTFIHKCRDENGPKFPELTKLTKILLIMPHSNAECERIFSIVTDYKQKKERLGVQILNVMAVYGSSMQARNLSCCSMNVGPDHVKKHSKMMYSFSK